MPGSSYVQFSDNVDSCEHDQTCTTDSLEIVSSPVRRGVRAVRMILKAGDTQDTSGTRVELQTRDKFEQVLEEEYFYGWSILVPEGWAFDPDDMKVVHQWHTGNTQPGGSPIVGLRIKGSSWLITRELVEGASTTLATAPVQRGVWTDSVMRIRWSPAATGVLVTWKDGVKLYEEAGQNMNAGVTTGGHYEKFGMYGSFGGVVKERTLYYDEVRVARGPNGYALVAP